jgi:hypothetical protein
MAFLFFCFFFNLYLNLYSCDDIKQNTMTGFQPNKAIELKNTISLLQSALACESANKKQFEDAIRNKWILKKQQLHANLEYFKTQLTERLNGNFDTEDDILLNIESNISFFEEQLKQADKNFKEEQETIQKEREIKLENLEIDLKHAEKELKNLNMQQLAEKEIDEKLLLIQKLQAMGYSFDIKFDQWRNYLNEKQSKQIEEIKNFESTLCSLSKEQKDVIKKKFNFFEFRKFWLLNPLLNQLKDLYIYEVSNRSISKEKLQNEKFFLDCRSKIKTQIEGFVAQSKIAQKNKQENIQKGIVQIGFIFNNQQKKQCQLAFENLSIQTKKQKLCDEIEKQFSEMFSEQNDFNFFIGVIVKEEIIKFIEKQNDCNFLDGVCNGFLKNNIFKILSDLLENNFSIKNKDDFYKKNIFAVLEETKDTFFKDLRKSIKDAESLISEIEKALEVLYFSYNPIMNNYKNITKALSSSAKEKIKIGEKTLQKQEALRYFYNTFMLESIGLFLLLGRGCNSPQEKFNNLLKNIDCFFNLFQEGKGSELIKCFNNLEAECEKFFEMFPEDEIEKIKTIVYNFLYSSISTLNKKSIKNFEKEDLSDLLIKSLKKENLSQLEKRAEIKAEVKKEWFLFLIENIILIYRTLEEQTPENDFFVMKELIDFADALSEYISFIIVDAKIAKKFEISKEKHLYFLYNIKKETLSLEKFNQDTFKQSKNKILLDVIKNIFHKKLLHALWNVSSDYQMQFDFMDEYIQHSFRICLFLIDELIRLARYDDLLKNEMGKFQKIYKIFIANKETEDIINIDKKELDSIVDNAFEGQELQQEGLDNFKKNLYAYFLHEQELICLIKIKKNFKNLNILFDYNNNFTFLKNAGRKNNIRSYIIYFDDYGFKPISFFPQRLPIYALANFKLHYFLGCYVSKKTKMVDCLKNYFLNLYDRNLKSKTQSEMVQKNANKAVSKEQKKNLQKIQKEHNQNEQFISSTMEKLKTKYFTSFIPMYNFLSDQIFLKCLPCENKDANIIYSFKGCLEMSQYQFINKNECQIKLLFPNFESPLKKTI